MRLLVSPRRVEWRIFSQIKHVSSGARPVITRHNDCGGVVVVVMINGVFKRRLRVQC
jgi:hypothetical protein